jgi:hypothetical protein
MNLKRLFPSTVFVAPQSVARLNGPLVTTGVIPLCSSSSLVPSYLERDNFDTPQLANIVA